MILRKLVRFALLSAGALLCLLLLAGSPAAEQAQSIEETLHPAKAGRKHSLSETRCPKGTKLVGKAGDEEFCQHKKEGHKTGPYALWYPEGTEGVATVGNAFETPWGPREARWRRGPRRLHMAGAYLKDKKHGVWVHWYERSQMSEMRVYKDGKKVRTWTGWLRHPSWGGSSRYSTNAEPQQAGLGHFKVDWSDSGGATLHCHPPIHYSRTDSDVAAPFAEVSASGDWTLLDLENTTPRLRKPKGKSKKSCAVRVCNQGSFDKLFCEAELASLLLVGPDELELAAEYLAQVGFEGERLVLWTAHLAGARPRAIARQRAKEPRPKVKRWVEGEGGARVERVQWVGPEDAPDLQALKAEMARFEKDLGLSWVKETQELIAQSVADSLLAMTTYKQPPSKRARSWEADRFWFGTLPASVGLPEYIEAWADTVDELRASSGTKQAGGNFRDWAYGVLADGVRTAFHRQLQGSGEPWNLPDFIDHWAAVPEVKLGEPWKTEAHAAMRAKANELVANSSGEASQQIISRWDDYMGKKWASSAIRTAKKEVEAKKTAQLRECREKYGSRARACITAEWEDCCQLRSGDPQCVATHRAFLPSDPRANYYIHKKRLDECEEQAKRRCSHAGCP